MKRKYKFRAPVSNRPISGAALEVSDFLRNVCLKLRIRLHPVHICKFLSPICKQDLFFLNRCPENSFSLHLLLSFSGLWALSSSHIWLCLLDRVQRLGKEPAILVG